MLSIEILPIGGHSDFGRNMTAVRVGEEIVVFDMGIKLDPLQGLPEGDGVDTLPMTQLRDIGALPDDRVLDNVRGKVVAIVLSHAHADHVGAVARLADRYENAVIIGSPYTVEFVKRMGDFGRQKTKPPYEKRLVTLHGNGRRRVGSRGLEVELVHVTHSILGATIPVLHTPKGAIVYALDFKLDDSPVLGERPDYRRLAKIGRDGVHLLITESTNAGTDARTDSEQIARIRLRDLLLGIDHRERGLFVTTFASNAARIHSILDYAHDLGRDVYLLGRSLEKYQSIANDLDMLHIPNDVKIAANRAKSEEALRSIAKRPERALVVLTGHQGEPGALLTRIAANQTPYRMSRDDHVIFSSNTIPTETCIAQRGELERKLRRAGTRVLNGAHVSGHASGQDHRELLALLQPEYIVPAHGGEPLQQAYARLAAEEGWKTGRDLHVLRNGRKHVLGRAHPPARRQDARPARTRSRASR